MKHFLKLAFLFLFLLVASRAGAQTSTINWTTVHQVIDGFGAADAQSGTSMSSANQTFFFNTAPPNIGLSLLRVGVTNGRGDPGSCASVSSSCAGVYVSDMQAIVAQGGRIYASSWSPPAAYKSNGSTSCTAGSGNGTLLTADYAAFATWIANFVQSVSTYAGGPTIYALSPQGEPQTCVSSDSTLWTAANLDTFIKTNLGPTFASDSITTLVFVPEPSGYAGLTGAKGGTTCMEDSACYNYVGGVNWHDYDATYTAPDTVNATPYPSGWATGKKYWETEVSGPNVGYGPTIAPGCTGGNWCPNLADALQVAAWIDDRLVNEGANAYFWWCFIGTSCLTYPPGSPTTATRAYVLGQYSDFVRPGMYRIDATHIPQSGVTVSAYQNTSTNHTRSCCITEDKPVK